MRFPLSGILKERGGGDYPMLAMCEARLGHPDKAVDYLMSGSGGFQFDDLGLATGGPLPLLPVERGIALRSGDDGGPVGMALRR